MGFASLFQGLKSFLQLNFFTRAAGIMLKGSLGQKVTVVMGCLGFLFGLYMAFKWILISTAGTILIYLAFRDFDASLDKP